MSAHSDRILRLARWLMRKEFKRNDQLRIGIFGDELVASVDSAGASFPSDPDLLCLNGPSDDAFQVWTDLVEEMLVLARIAK